MLSKTSMSPTSTRIFPLKTNNLNETPSSTSLATSSRRRSTYYRRRRQWHKLHALGSRVENHRQVLKELEKRRKQYASYYNFGKVRGNKAKRQLKDVESQARKEAKRINTIKRKARKEKKRLLTKFENGKLSEKDTEEAFERILQIEKMANLSGEQLNLQAQRKQKGIVRNGAVWEKVREMLGRRVQQMLTHKIAKRESKMKRLDTRVQVIEDSLSTDILRKDEKLLKLSKLRAHNMAELQLLKLQMEYVEYRLLYGPGHIFTEIKKQNVEQYKKTLRQRKRNLKKSSSPTETRIPIKPGEIFQRSRLVLQWRARQWTSGLLIGQSCEFSKNQCSLDSYCKLVTGWGWKCFPKSHQDNGQHGNHVNSWQYNVRSNEVFRRVLSWSQSIPFDQSCSPNGIRCSLGLECSLVNPATGEHKCVHEQTNENLAKRDSADAGVRHITVLLDRIHVSGRIDQMAKDWKYDTDFGSSFCDSLYEKIERQCKRCCVLVLPLHSDPFVLRISSVQFHAKIYFSVHDQLIAETGIWLYEAGSVDLDNRPQRNNWCLRE